MKLITAKTLSLALVICFYAASTVVAGETDKGGPVPAAFSSLLEKMVAEGLDAKYLQRIFSDARTEFLQKTQTINIKYVENPEHYKKFTGKEYVKLGSKFMNRNSGFMKKIEKRYGVPGEVITAILLIETKLGEKRGKYRIFNVLASVAVAGSNSNIDTNYKRLKKRYPDLKKEDIAKRARRRGKWAYGELKSLVKLAQGENRDILDMKGSWAGAYGIPQFIPSSYLAYGVDGNDDGVRNLDNYHDAIASVANYLKQHGWKPGISHEQKKKVIWKYNHSELYVETVLASSKLIGAAGE